MNPCDALTQDYRLYYNGTWMRLEDGSICHITTEDEEGDRGFFKFCDEAQRYIDVDPLTTSIWWPRAGTYNSAGSAFFIGRRARRTMKKSASPESFYVKYGGNMHGTRMMNMMRDDPKYISFLAAQEVLNTGAMASVAVARNVILVPKGMDLYTVIYRGMEVGEMKDSHFDPLYPNDPASKRVIIELEREGIP